MLKGINLIYTLQGEMGRNAPRQCSRAAAAPLKEKQLMNFINMLYTVWRSVRIAMLTIEMKASIIRARCGSDGQTKLKLMNCQAKYLKMNYFKFG